MQIYSRKKKILPIEKNVVFLQIDWSKQQSGTCTRFVPTSDKKNATE